MARTHPWRNSGIGSRTGRPLKMNFFIHFAELLTVCTVTNPGSNVQGVKGQEPPWSLKREGWGSPILTPALHMIRFFLDNMNNNSEVKTPLKQNKTNLTPATQELPKKTTWQSSRLCTAEHKFPAVLLPFSLSTPFHCETGLVTRSAYFLSSLPQSGAFSFLLTNMKTGSWVKT